MRAQGTSIAAPDALFALLADTAGWPRWTDADEAVLAQPAASDEPEGVGALRHLRWGRRRSVERVVAFERPTHFAYSLLSGLPMLDHRADVRLEPRPGGGTNVTWTGSYRSPRLGAGLPQCIAYRLLLRRLVRQLCRNGATPR